MTFLPTMSDERRWTRATVDSLAFGLAEPARVLPIPDGDWRWNERCSICYLTRAEDAEWEPHQVERRVAYAERTGIPYEPWRCGRCGEPVGADAVQSSGLRYCCEEHAEPFTVVVYEPPVWMEVDGVWTEVRDPGELVVGSALCAGDPR